MDAANAAHRGGRETGGERDEGGGGEGRRDSGGSEAEDGPVQRHAGCCRLTPSLSQPAPSPAVQGHGHGAIQLSLASIAVVPASHSVICSAISVCFSRAADSPRTVVGGRRAGRGLSRRQRRSLHSRDSSRPYVLRVQTAHHPTFSRTVRVFSQKGKRCWPWSGVSPRGNCELFGRLPLRHSPRPSAVSDRLRRSPRPSSHCIRREMLVPQLPVVVVAGYTRCASYECHQLHRPATVRVGGDRRRCRA